MSLKKRYHEVVVLLHCKEFIRAVMPLFPDCRRETIFRSEDPVICRMISVRYHSGYTRHVMIIQSETAGSRSWSRINPFGIEIF